MGQSILSAKRATLLQNSTFANPRLRANELSFSTKKAIFTETRKAIPSHRAGGQVRVPAAISHPTWGASPQTLRLFATHGSSRAKKATINYTHKTIFSKPRAVACRRGQST